MKKIILTLAIFTSVVMFTGCKKKDISPTNKIEKPIEFDKDSAHIKIIRYEQGIYGYWNDLYTEDYSDTLYSDYRNWNSTIEFKLERGHTYKYVASGAGVHYILANYSHPSYKIYIDGVLLIDREDCFDGVDVSDACTYVFTI